jgi:hypothetical protein
LPRERLNKNEKTNVGLPSLAVLMPPAFWPGNWQTAYALSLIVKVFLTDISPIGCQIFRNFFEGIENEYRTCKGEKGTRNVWWYGRQCQSSLTFTQIRLSMPLC